VLNNFIKVLVLLSVCSFASANEELSGYTKLGFLSVDDPDGSTEQVAGATIGGRYLYPLKRRNQWLFAGIDYTSFTLDAGTNTIGQNVVSYGMTGGYEGVIPYFKKKDVRWNAALKIAQETFNQRHTVDQDGFLSEHLKNRTVSSYSALVGIDYNFNYGKTARNSGWDFSVGGYVDYALSQSTSGYGIKLSVR
jgi:hypothetical protein